MGVAVAGFGLLVLVIGVLGLLQPARLVAWVERTWQSRAGFQLAIALRALLGILLIASASSTRFPWLIGALGVLSLAAAAALPVLGYARVRSFVEWWTARSTGFVRAWSLVACAFGAFLVYAAV
jgi:hypothetical protein